MKTSSRSEPHSDEMRAEYDFSGGVRGKYVDRKGPQHDNYGKSVLALATRGACQRAGPSVSTNYGASSAHIDGTVGLTVAVEIESRTGKQVRGAILDLILHDNPKKLLILIPKYFGKHQPQECEFILKRFVGPQDFRVVLLEGTGDDPCLETDALKVRAALAELGWEVSGSGAG
jgi:hypothetical protein